MSALQTSAVLFGMAPQLPTKPAHTEVDESMKWWPSQDELQKQFQRSPLFLFFPDVFLRELGSKLSVFSQVQKQKVQVVLKVLPLSRGGGITRVPGATSPDTG